MRGLLEGARGQVEFNLPWMTWNLFLAFLPWAIAAFTFRPARRVTMLWTFWACTCIAFLPNAAYVLTDIIHLPSAMRAEQSDPIVFAVILPMYAVLFVLGFAAYVDTLRRISAFVVARRWLPWRWPFEVAMHAVTAVAIYAGRIHRFNSWDLLDTPGEVWRVTMDGFTRRAPVAGMLLTFVIVAGGYAVARPAFDYLIARAFGGVATPLGMLSGAEVKNDS